MENAEIDNSMRRRNLDDDRIYVRIHYCTLVLEYVLQYLIWLEDAICDDWDENV